MNARSSSRSLLVALVALSAAASAGCSSGGTCDHPPTPMFACPSSPAADGGVCVGSPAAYPGVLPEDAGHAQGCKVTLPVCGQYASAGQAVTCVCTGPAWSCPQ